MDRRWLVVVSGCSGGGKSSLLTEMSRRGYSTCPEPGRQIVKEQLLIGGDALPWDNAQKFIELCVSRACLYYNSARPTSTPVLFDRSMLDNIKGYKTLGVETPPAMLTALQRYRYAPTVFLVPPWEDLFENDPERRHSFDSAVAEYEALLDAYAEHGYETVVIPRDTLARRADFLADACRRLLGKKEDE